MSTKVCTKCGEDKSLDQYYKRAKSRGHGPRSQCIACVSKHEAAYRERNREVIKQRANQRNRRLKQQVIALYGGICECCGIDELDFLTIDHVNNDGKQERGAYFYGSLVKQPRRSDLRVLCWNCNSAKGLFGTCPHERQQIAA